MLSTASPGVANRVKIRPSHRLRTNGLYITASAASRRARDVAVSLLSALVVLTTGTPAALGAADKLPEFTIRVGRDSSNDMGPSVMYDERLRAGDEDERSVQAPIARAARLLKGPKGKQVKICAGGCMQECFRGGSSGPGVNAALEGSRKSVFNFKNGFRSRAYCLKECSSFCGERADSTGDEGQPDSKK